MNNEEILEEESEDITATDAVEDLMEILEEDLSLAISSYVDIRFDNSEEYLKSKLTQDLLGLFHGKVDQAIHTAMYMSFYSSIPTEPSELVEKDMLHIMKHVSSLMEKSLVSSVRRVKKEIKKGEDAFQIIACELQDIMEKAIYETLDYYMSQVKEENLCPEFMHRLLLDTIVMEMQESSKDQELPD